MMIERTYAFEITYVYLDINGVMAHEGGWCQSWLANWHPTSKWLD